MKLTKEQLKQIIKEELEEMMEPAPAKGNVEFPELPGFERLAAELTQAYNSDEAGSIATLPNFVGIEHYISFQSVMKMEDYAYQLQSRDYPLHITDWIYAFHDVIAG